MTDSYAYDAWGNLIDRTGNTEQPYQYVGQLGYYTHYQAPAFNLLQLGVRFYDPEVGRFTQRDAIGDGLNWYAYADNDPVAFVDPEGLASDNACDRYGGCADCTNCNGLWWAFCYERCIVTYKKDKAKLRWCLGGCDAVKGDVEGRFCHSGNPDSKIVDWVNWWWSTIINDNLGLGIDPRTGKPNQPCPRPPGDPPGGIDINPPGGKPVPPGKEYPKPPHGRTFPPKPK